MNHLRAMRFLKRASDITDHNVATRIDEEMTAVDHLEPEWAGDLASPRP